MSPSSRCARAIARPISPVGSGRPKPPPRAPTRSRGSRRSAGRRRAAGCLRSGASSRGSVRTTIRPPRPARRPGATESLSRRPMRTTRASRRFCARRPCSRASRRWCAARTLRTCARRATTAHRSSRSGGCRRATPSSGTCDRRCTRRERTGRGRACAPTAAGRLSRGGSTRIGRPPSGKPRCSRAPRATRCEADSAPTPRSHARARRISPSRRGTSRRAATAALATLRCCARCAKPPTRGAARLWASASSRRHAGDDVARLVHYPCAISRRSPAARVQRARRRWRSRAAAPARAGDAIARAEDEAAASPQWFALDPAAGAAKAVAALPSASVRLGDAGLAPRAPPRSRSPP